MKYPKPKSVLHDLAGSGPSETRAEALRLLTLPDVPETFVDCPRRSRRAALRILVSNRGKSAKARLAAFKELCWGVLPEADTEAGPLSVKRTPTGIGSQEEALDMSGISPELLALLTGDTPEDAKRDRRELERVKIVVLASDHQGEGCADELKTLHQLLDRARVGGEAREYADQIRPILNGYETFVLNGGKVFVHHPSPTRVIVSAHSKDITGATGIPTAMVSKLGAASLDRDVREFPGMDVFIKVLNTAYKSKSEP